MKVLTATIFFTLFFGLVEVIKNKFKIDAEISRKIVHILAGIVVAFLPFYMSFLEISFLSLIFIPVMLVSKRINFFSSIHSVKRKTLGEVYFPGAVFLVATAFPYTPLYIYGMLVMSISDGLANVFGQRFGKSKFQIGSVQKSYLGSSIFFVTALTIGLTILTFSYTLSPLTLVMTGIIALILTLTESILTGGLDNLVLPTLGAALLYWMLGFLGIR